MSPPSETLQRSLRRAAASGGAHPHGLRQRHPATGDAHRAVRLPGGNTGAHAQRAAGDAAGTDAQQSRGRAVDAVGDADDLGAVARECGGLEGAVRDAAASRPQRADLQHGAVAVGQRARAQRHHAAGVADAGGIAEV